jgi:hypothetical protein
MKVLIKSLNNSFESDSDALNPCFEASLFNMPEHLKLQANQNLYGFYLEKKKEIQGVFYLFLDENKELKKALSPFQMPFGSFEFEQSLDYESLIFWIRAIKEFCRKHQIKSLFIQHSPFCYAPEQTHLLTQVLLYAGFRVSNAELCHFIEISESVFEKNLHHSEKRRLQKCQNAGFQFEKLENIGLKELQEVYEFVANCRKRKNFPVSMSFESFKRLFKEFPDKHFIFAVKNKTEFIALTVAIEVRSDILYNFYPADHADYQEFSPTVMLIKGLYEYCQNKQYKILDLGISTYKSEPNLGLIRFKKNLGAKNCLKLSFELLF